MRRLTFTARRAIVTLAATVVASLVVAAPGAQAALLNDQGTEAGVSLLPSVRDSTLPPGVSRVSSSGPCLDPWLSADLGGPLMPPSPASDGLYPLCYRGGGVMHQNETFALTWDPNRWYWSQTRGYMEQFLRDVADGSGSLASPYAVTTQYNDGGGRAQNASVFGGGCIDYGQTGGSACDFGIPSGAGSNYPSNGCTPGGDSFVSKNSVVPNTVCLTDAQLQGELSTMIPQTGILGRTQPGHTPVVTLLMPPSVDVCLDRFGTLCSANGYLTPPPPTVSTATLTSGSGIAAGTYRVAVTYQTSTGESAPSASQTIRVTGAASTITINSPPYTSGATGWYAYVTAANGLSFTRQSGPTALGTNVTLSSLNPGGPPPAQPAFCSYHSQMNVGGTQVAYVVQPWTAGTSCDEPGVPDIPDNPTPSQLSIAIGQRLVSPLSQSHIAAIVDPGFDGWAALDGSETDDNHACVPLPDTLDQVTVGSSSQNPYWLQREFDNAAALEFDPWTYFGCAPVVNLAPTFVAPSAVNQGDVVELDGSATPSTLIVPRANYVWNFGDGTTGSGPSVEHSYSRSGIYTVTLTVTDRGGNTATQSATITVLGPAGQTPTPPTSQPVPGGGSAPSPALSVRLQLTPRSLRAVLNRGIALHVRSNKAANGILTISISRSLAKRAHIKVGRGAIVVIARGTTAGIRNGISFLSLRLPRATAAKLKRLRHVTLMVRLSLVAAGGGRLSLDAAGRY